MTLIRKNQERLTSSFALNVPSGKELDQLVSAEKGRAMAIQFAKGFQNR